MSEDDKAPDLVNAGAGLVDVETMNDMELGKLVKPDTAQQILNWIEDRLRDGNIIYASDLTKNPLFEARRDGSYQFHIVVQPLRGKTPAVGNESPE